MSVSNENADHDSGEYILSEQDTAYYPYGMNVVNWYFYGDFYSSILLSFLTNEIVNDPEFSIYFDYEKKINFWLDDYVEDPSVFDINNLFIKMNGLKTIYLPESIDSQITTLPYSVEHIKCTYQNIKNIEKYTNLKKYEFYNSFSNFIIPQFADGLTDIKIVCRTLEGSFAFLPQSVEYITLEIVELHSNLDMWPCNLKKLSIVIGDTMNGYTIEMLPDSLESFELRVPSYLHYIDFPPYLKLLHFMVDDIDSPYIVNIPESVVNYAINYCSQKEIDKLPKKCQVFAYIGCPDDIHKNLKKNVKGVAYYTKRIKNYDY